MDNNTQDHGGTHVAQRRRLCAVLPRAPVVKVIGLARRGRVRHVQGFVCAENSRLVSRSAEFGSARSAAPLGMGPVRPELGHKLSERRALFTVAQQWPPRLKLGPDSAPRRFAFPFRFHFQRDQTRPVTARHRFKAPTKGKSKQRSSPKECPFCTVLSL